MRKLVHLRIVNRDGSQRSHLFLLFIVFLLSQGVETDMPRQSPLWRKLSAPGTRRNPICSKDLPCIENSGRRAGSSMRALCAFLIAMALPTFGMAASRDSSREESPKLAGKSLDICKTDIRKFCDAADLKEECLVAHWAKISKSCQDVLAMPMRDGGDGGK